MKDATRLELLQGTLDMLILQTLSWGPQHGYGISQAIRVGSSDLLQVETGSLYPALHRLERRGWLSAEWKQSDNNQRTKVYRLTATGPETAGGRAHALGSAQRRDQRADEGQDAAVMKLPWSRRVEIDEELRAHLRMAIQDRVDRGEDPAEAARRARRELGNLYSIHERTRASWGGVRLERWLRDLRFAFRQMRRAPGFAAVAILTLGLGLGSTTAMFAIVDSV
jgi:transcriptional regulator